MNTEGPFTDPFIWHCPWWKMLLARILGHKIIVSGGTSRFNAVAHEWRGVIYIRKLATQRPFHRPVDRCCNMRTLQAGFLCNCGRTITGHDKVLDHFGQTYQALETEWRDKRVTA